MKLLSFLLTLFIVSSFAYAKNVAVVKMMRGKVFKVNDSGEAPLKKGDWLSEGDLVQTKKASFARLVFIDKSQVNVGPKSEMKIEKFSKKDPGLLNIVKGKIRAKVTKDYLQMNKGAKSKLYMKSKSAVMGIRGTDFLFTYSPETKATSAVLFEGKVAFSKTKFNQRINYKDLESAVNRDRVQIRAGEFSVANNKAKRALLPAKLNVAQVKALEKNDTFKEIAAPKGATQKRKVGSFIPKGLDGKVVSSSDKDLKEHVEKIVKVKGFEKKKDGAPNSKAKGFVSKEGNIKPSNGAFLHVGTGNVIEPGQDSSFDAHSNTFVATGSTGSVGPDGEYIPPKGVIINSNGEFVEKRDGRMPASFDENKKPKLQVIEAGGTAGPGFLGPCPPEFCPNGPLMDRHDRPEFDPLSIPRSRIKFQFNNVESAP